MTINYERAQKRWRGQKAALTRAINSGDYAKVVATTRKTVAEWNEDGAWPDDWHRWNIALEDAWWKAKARYMRDEIDAMPAHVSINDL